MQWISLWRLLRFWARQLETISNNLINKFRSKKVTVFKKKGLIKSGVVEEESVKIEEEGAGVQEKGVGVLEGVTAEEFASAVVKMLNHIIDTDNMMCLSYFSYT